MISKYGKKVMRNAGAQNRLEKLQMWCDKITGTIKEELGEDWEDCEVATEFDRICASVEQLKQLFE